MSGATAHELYEKLLATSTANDEQSASRFLTEHQLHDAFAFDATGEERAPHPARGQLYALRPGRGVQDQS